MTYDWEGVRARRTRWIKVVISMAVLAAILLAATQVFAYSRKDAHYVTTSKNGAVLDYVVCLHDEVGNRTKGARAQGALDHAVKACHQLAGKLPRSATEPDAGDIYQMILECGFEPGNGSPDAC